MLLFRSSLSGGGEANYDNYSVQINGQTNNNFISLVPPLWAFLEEDEDIEEFNKPVTFGSAIGGYFSPDGGEGFFTWASNFNQPVNIPPLMNNFHDMFYECFSFNSPINWGEAIIGNTCQMFYDCTNFNQQERGFEVPSQIGDCQFLFANCNHISGIYIGKDSNFNVTDLNVCGMIDGLTNELECHIIVEGPDQEFSNRLYTQVLSTGPIRGMYTSDWNFQDWGCFNLEHNVYIIKNYEEYANWAGIDLDSPSGGDGPIVINP